MPLQKQTVALSLRQGLDTKSDPKQTVPGRLLILENGVLTKIGQVQKRNGYAALSSAGSIGATLTAARMVSTFKGQLFLAGAGLGYGYATSQSSWAAKGPCEALQISTTPVIRNVYQQTTQDATFHPAGVTVAAWEDSSGGSRYSVIDTATGQPIVPNVQLGTNAARPKCLSFGNYAIIVFYEQATSHLRFISIPVLSPQNPSAPSDIALNVGSQVYDASVISGRLFVAYANNTGAGTQLSVKYLTSTFIVSSDTQLAATAIPTAISIFGDSTSSPWVAWADGTAGAHITSVDFNIVGVQFPAVTLGAAIPRNVTGIAPVGSTATVFFDVAGGLTYNTLTEVCQVVWHPGPPRLTYASSITAGGTLAAGTYYYVVTALGSAGETLASNELAVVATGTTSSVILAWTAVAGATGYRVYRGTTAGGENTYYAPGNVLTFTDTGAAGTAGTPPGANTFLGSVAATVLARSVGLGSKPWYVNGTVHVLAAYQSALQPTYFIMTAAGSTVGRFAPGVGGGLTAKTILPEVTQTSTAGIFGLAYLQTDEIGVQAGVILAQTGVNTATLDYTAPQMGLELSDDLHLTGGMLHAFDGVQVAEHNFLLYPENVSTSLSGTGGLLGSGSYQYVIVFEWWDNYVIHQSAPSVPATVTTSTATSQVTLTIPTLRITNKATPISVVVYRTAVNGTVFYRLTPPTSPLVNTMAADTVSYVDSAADSAIIGNAQLYTTGGEVENWAAPASAIVCSYNNRMMLVSSENPLEVWFSKQVIQGTPVEFSPFFTMTIDQRGGPVTGMTQMDDKLILFKRNQIFALIGDGPAPNGTPVPAYPPAERVTADSGCKASKSLVLIPTGLMYQSDKGIYLLGRDLSTTYIGAPVEAFNGATVTSATQVPNTTQVRFTLDSGVCMVYDWLIDQWGVFTNLAAADSTIFQGQFTYAQVGGLALTETPGVFTDNGAAIKLRIQTSWLSFAGLQGFQRVWEMLVLGEYRSGHNLRVSVAFDFDPTPHQVVDISAAALLAQPAYGQGSPYGTGVFGGQFPLYQFRIKMLQEKCQAVQITIEDNQVAPFGEGMAISAISFTAGVIGGTKKIPANRTFGA